MRTTVGTQNGQPVDMVRLVSDVGVEVDVLALGAAVVGWRVPVGGVLRPVVLGSTDLSAYRRRSEYLGCVVGRVANRIRDARFALDGVWHSVDANEDTRCLHGGRLGLSSQVWTLEEDVRNGAVHAVHHSPHGAMGFPGAVDVRVTWRLEGFDLHLSIDATADRRTPLSMTQHLYFNLDGGGTILDHHLRVDAARTLCLDEQSCATGDWTAVEGTVRDFRNGRRIAPAGGRSALDHYFGFDADRDPASPPVGLRSGDGALALSLWTDRPGVQIYDGAGLASGVAGWPQVGPWSGICLEDHDPPGAVMHPELGDIVYGPDRPYRHRSRIRIAPC